VEGKPVFTEFEERNAPVEEIVAASKGWRRTQNDHSRAIGLMGICDMIDEPFLQQYDPGKRIARIRAQSLNGLQVKAVAASYFNFDSQCAKLIHESIVRDLNSIGENCGHTGRSTRARGACGLRDLRRFLTSSLRHRLIGAVYLGGTNGPVVTHREGWEVDGLEVKCRLDFGAGIESAKGI